MKTQPNRPRSHRLEVASIPLLLLMLMPLLGVVTATGVAGEGIALTRSSPEDGAVVERPVRSARSWFDQTPDPGASTIEIVGPSLLELKGLHTMGENDLMATVAGPMPDGIYTLRYQAAGADGERQSGSLSFEIRRAAKASSEDPKGEPGSAASQ
jgi:methionine-rich copper-binding protein CopC